MPQGADLSPTANLLEPGRNRFGFSLYNRGDKQIGALKVRLYAARGLDETVWGPIPARFERLAVASAFRSRQSSNPGTAHSLYVSNIRFAHSGGYNVIAVSELSGQYLASAPIQVMVSHRSDVPAVGERAISVHTPTVASAGGDLSKIDTRTPPDSMHEIDLAVALRRHRPVLLLFASPGLRESRVGAIVTDVAEQLHARFRPKMDFIHVELYNDNEPDQGLRAAVRAWHLTSEPFAFAIDRRGVVVARLEGAFSVRELRAAVKKALR